MTLQLGELRVPRRILMGPGPTEVNPRVLRAMSLPVLGHLDPAFLEIMNQVTVMLRVAFQTENELTLAVSGTGTAGMEATLFNLIEPGDEVLVAVKGYFGDRMCQMAERAGAKLTRIDQEWGKVFEPATVAAALKTMRKPKLVAMVHAETSTGALQPIPEIAALAHEHGALMLIDCVTSLGGVPVEIDAWGVDAAYSGTQKCIGSPPGLAPVTFSPRAMEVIRDRSTPPRSWYLDMGLIARYWGSDRVYHHTAPINAIYGCHEALRLMLDEGLPARFARHLLNHHALVAGVEAMGQTLHADPAHRLPMLNTVRVPDGLDDARIRSRLLNEFGIEIAGGLGALRGKVLRVGIMGYSSNPHNVTLFLASLEHILASEGLKVPRGAALEAAMNVYSEAAVAEAAAAGAVCCPSK